MLFTLPPSAIRTGLAAVALAALAALAACSSYPAGETIRSAAGDERTDGKGDLELQVTVRQVEGSILVTLVDEAGWNGTAPQIAGFAEQVTASPVIIMVDGLEPGLYAVKAFHDLNGNGEMDTNVMGIPSEPFAFSNNAAGNFGPPDFAAAAFDVTPGTTIHMMNID
ncbi:DUF2141 domain-containing protein [Aquisalinus flavus]|uniref:DUF2141 domain-containing protein n=1 Tax=Aquisalinus flavus TaxID=1526572 RepID=A0A8J2Y5U9_9PROT|nr:DUF2141 domain-containing protein [Aquisalinus flavus]MBD0425323.1 DUF2141 domain-containing protein [Aquisalinus flavus]UNE49025.1 DUF2141 domain-containing protein [Aquisalinus flavus]GGD16991.1 hypothetical protein GCM10011342_27200 [Aquisalinus flavus]